jgi:hypothetical protein
VGFYNPVSFANSFVKSEKKRGSLGKETRWGARVDLGHIPPGDLVRMDV